MDQVEREAQEVINVAGAQHKAEVVSAFYRALREGKVPAASAYEFTHAEFYPSPCWVEDE